MHLHFERNTNAICDSNILSLTWMGKVPDDLPDEENWKLDRFNYYQEGWLATGTGRGIVGVTFTTSHCKKSLDYPRRTNYNLRGHKSEVIFVEWNEPYQKLASCDASGVIFVWMKYEGRWSIELINDRNTPVTHFAWSHDGRMALICYQDGFVLVGSVAGQRYWSSMLNLDSTITCGIWTPDDLQVYFGTSLGDIVVMSIHGAMIAQVSLTQASVISMAWSCEKFKMEEEDENEFMDSVNLVLAVSFSTGHIFFMKSYDDVAPIQVNTGLGEPLFMEWSNRRELLAVAGVASHVHYSDYVNMLKCFTNSGELLYSTLIPYSQSPVTAMTWGHYDKRLFVATGGVIHIAWVSRRVASLQFLSRLKVASSLPLGESSVQSLPLPPRIKHLISNLFAQTIRCCVPESKGLRKFVSRTPTKNGTRFNCTMIRHGDEHLGSGACYTLYLEYLGGLVPLLKGKRISKIRPEFVIFDPQVDGVQKEIPWTNKRVTARGSDPSDSEREDGCNASPRAQRKKKKRRNSPADHDIDLTYVDNLPEGSRLVEVTSNIWGTKFKIHGLTDCVPANLGQVTYKTSLLHLQPRQMRLVMTELKDNIPHIPDPSFNPKVFSEDEEEDKSRVSHKKYLPYSSKGLSSGDIPIAPMTPKRDGNQSQLFNSRPSKADGNEKHFFRSPTFFYVSPSLELRDPTELRKFFVDGFNKMSAMLNQEDAIRREKRISEKSMGQIKRDTPSLGPSARTQNYFYTNDRSTSHKYQNDIPVGVTGEFGAENPPSARSSYKLKYRNTDDCTFCEKCKIIVMEEKPKLRQEKTETSFLNNQMCQKSKKSLNPQSPKNAIAPYNFFCDSRTPNAVTNLSSTDFSSLNIGKMKTVLRKCLSQGNLKMTEEDTENLVDRMTRSYSVGYLDDVNTRLVACEVTLRRLKRNAPKRLVLVEEPKKQNASRESTAMRSTLSIRGKSRSIDCGELLLNGKKYKKKKGINLAEERAFVDPLIWIKPESPPKESVRDRVKNELKEIKAESSACMMGNSNESFSLPSPILPRSQPVTPAMGKKKRNQSSSPIRKHLLNSPLLRRRRAKSKTESSDDDKAFSGDEAFTSGSHFEDLETFQKAQFRQKLKRGKVRDGNAVPNIRQFVMRNKTPIWNQHSQVYQLDFGGRVTQESAKNFQIEYKKKQVMQFGRIDGNAYTLDFQYPFSVLQAFAVALASVTQRFK